MSSLEYPSVNYLFRCIPCRFISDNKKDYRRHTLSAKHAKFVNRQNASLSQVATGHLSMHDNSVVLPQRKPEPPTGQPPAQLAFTFDKSIYKYCDKCGHKYHSKSGLWKHRKTCAGTGCYNMSTMDEPVMATAATTATDQEFKMMMMDMLKNNQEFQHKILEMMCTHQQSIAVATATAANAVAAATAAAATAATKAPTTATYTNSNNYNGTTNSHNNNNTFNMQFFLNEQCKDAMNITDFASSIHLKVSDLDDFASMGYVEGMSKLFLDSLRETDIFKRPIHCSDTRRETLYVKDDDKWEREGPENTKITNAVRVVEHKNIILVNEWAKQNPRCENSSTKENARYINMSRAVLDGDDKNIAKVIKKVAKEVVIEKPCRGGPGAIADA